ncbi:hypothetical protein J6590_057647 [Homalodisca vitripennis]|nr:hypothetical protein J6590_057647 [Homalodisca vitripennis]
MFPEHVIARSSEIETSIIRRNKDLKAAIWEENAAVSKGTWTNGLKVISEPPPTAGQADFLLKQDRSTGIYPSSIHARRCLTWLSCDDQCTLYTTH